jgi:hypothetical protein
LADLLKPFFAKPHCGPLIWHRGCPIRRRPIRDGKPLKVDLSYTGPNRHKSVTPDQS